MRGTQAQMLVLLSEQDTRVPCVEQDVAQAATEEEFLHHLSDSHQHSTRQYDQTSGGGTP